MGAVRHHGRRPQHRSRGVQADDQLPAVILQSDELDDAFFEEDDFLGRERLPEEVRDRRELAGRRRLRGRGQQHTG